MTNNNDVTEELDVYDRETDCFAGAQSLHFIQETIRWIFHETDSEWT